MGKKKIMAMSTICADVFDANEIRLGGEALNFAMNILLYPNVEIGIMGAVGDDLIGQKAMRCISSSDIDKSCVHVIEGGKTASNRIYHDAHGDRYFKEDSWDGGVYQSFQLSEYDREKLQKVDLVFINYNSPNFAEIMKLKKKYGFALAVDFDVLRNYSELENLVSDIEFAFFSGDESTLAELKKWSLQFDGIFNATLSDQGSVSFCKGEEYKVKAVPVAHIVDTTGCGDSYHAAFVASYLENHDIVKAMEEGSIRAAVILKVLGGFD